MARPPVRQHWVPKLYLRSFCAAPQEREQIHVYDIKSGAKFLTSIANTAVRKHFYTLNANTDNPSFAVEAALSHLESQTAPILTAVLENAELPDDMTSRSVLAQFIATLHLRTRQGLDVIHAHREEVRAGAQPTHGSLTGSPAAELLALDSEGMRERFAKSAVIVGNRIGAHIFAMHWRLLRATSGFFITSENPVGSVHKSEKQWGLGSPGAQTMLPLSPSLFLHLSNEPTLQGTGIVDVPASGVHALNALTLLAAEQFVNSPRSFDELADLVSEREVGSQSAFGRSRAQET